VASCTRLEKCKKKSTQILELHEVTEVFLTSKGKAGVPNMPTQVNHKNT